jgi:hypothetical protein
MARFSGSGGGTPGPAGPPGPAANTGDITFDEIKIIGAGEASGDGSGNGTIQLVPDTDLYENDQYLIIDPTQPSHIHIRAGGEQDESNAELILGAERTNVRISDYGNVSISTKNTSGLISNSYENVNETSNEDFITDNIFADIEIGDSVVVDENEYFVSDIEYNAPIEGYKTIKANGAIFTAGETYTFSYFVGFGDPSWQFENNGILSGPYGNVLGVYGITNPTPDIPLTVFAADRVMIYGQNGEFLNDNDLPENQIATLGDIGTDTVYAVQGATTGTQPTFNGDPLFTSSYVRMSSYLVHFRIDVDMDNITGFGTGQYYVTLPFNSKYNYKFREGCLHDISGEDQFHISGHVVAGSNILYLFWTQQNGQDEPFTSTAPVTLQTDDNFHISGTYVAEPQ